MSKPTPGPWTLSFPTGCVPVDSEAMANARLLAAAPDLLAACEAILDAVQYDDLGKNMLISSEAAMKARDLADFAIAKANGTS